MCVPEYSPHLEPVLSPLLLDKRVEDDTGVCVCVLSVCTRIQSPPGACVVATAARQTCRGRHRCVCVCCVYPNTVQSPPGACVVATAARQTCRGRHRCVCVKCVYPNTVPTWSLCCRHCCSTNVSRTTQVCVCVCVCACVCVLSVCTRIQSPPGACVVATAARQTCRGRHRCVCVISVCTRIQSSPHLELVLSPLLLDKRAEDDTATGTGGTLCREAGIEKRCGCCCQRATPCSSSRECSHRWDAAAESGWGAAAGLWAGREGEGAGGVPVCVWVAALECCPVVALAAQLALP